MEVTSFKEVPATTYFYDRNGKESGILKQEQNQIELNHAEGLILFKMDTKDGEVRGKFVSMNQRLLVNKNSLKIDKEKWALKSTLASHAYTIQYFNDNNEIVRSEEHEIEDGESIGLTWK